MVIFFQIKLGKKPQTNKTPPKPAELQISLPKKKKKKLGFLFSVGWVTIKAHFLPPWPKDVYRVAGFESSHVSPNVRVQGEPHRCTHTTHGGSRIDTPARTAVICACNQQGDLDVVSLLETCCWCTRLPFVRPYYVSAVHNLFVSYKYE